MRPSDTALIIGGGVIGVCAAYCLAQRNWNVILLEKGGVCSGASYGNAGFILPSHSVPLASPGVLRKGLRWMLDAKSPFYIRPRLDFELFSWLLKFRAACSQKRVREAIPLLRDLHRESLSLYEQLTAAENLQCGFTRNGMLTLFRTPKGMEDGIREARLLAEYGIEYRVLEGEALQEKVPQVLPGVLGGVYYPEDAHLIPADFVTGLARAAQEKGVFFHTHTEVLGFAIARRKIAAVHTTRGDFEAQEVILAAGSWSGAIAQDLGLRLPIQPAKGYSITVKRPESAPAVPLLLNEARVAVTPMGENLRFGGTLEMAGLDLSINRRRVEAILKGARSYLGGLDSLEMVEIWRGLRPCTPDGLPIIGRSKAYDNLTIAAGHAMIGQSLGPITGKLVSRIVCRDAPDPCLASLSAERF